MIRSIDKTRRLYRQYDPGWYLYRRVTSHGTIADRFSDDFIELVYVTLISWNMNSRGAKLADWDTFKESIRHHRRPFVRLAKYKLERLSRPRLEEIVEGDLRTLFDGLRLVADSKPRLVTYSKALHFFLPRLIVPIDRKYTLQYFYRRNSVPESIDDQFTQLSEILEECRSFAASVHLEGFQDRRWNANIPKTIDNMIIGYQI